jgi:glycine oxidase
MTKGQPDAIVIGGGVIGLSVAWELQRRERKVLVLDRGVPTGVASRAAAGMLAPTSEVELEDDRMLALAFDSLERYPAFVAELERVGGGSCEYRPDGTLWVALTRDDEGDLDHLESTIRARSLPCRRLTRDEVLDREPHLAGRILDGLLVESDLQVDPRRLTGLLENAVKAMGGAVRRDANVRAIEAGNGSGPVVTIERPDGISERAQAAAVVLAAGAWSSEEIALPIRGLAVRPVKGQIVRLRGTPILRHVVRHPDVYLVPRRDGDLLIGATMEEMGFDPSPTAGAVHDLLRKAIGLLPGLYDLEVAETAVGFRPALEDNRPAIGATELPGLFVAAGHGRSGVLLAPATAHYLGERIVGGTDPRELRPFGLGRCLHPTAGGGD